MDGAPGGAPRVLGVSSLAARPRARSLRLYLCLENGHRVFCGDRSGEGCGAGGGEGRAAPRRDMTLQRHRVAEAAHGAHPAAMGISRLASDPREPQVVTKGAASQEQRGLAN